MTARSGSGRGGASRPGAPKSRKSKSGSKTGATRFSGRNLHTRVKTAKGRKTSSKLWLERQLNDPYVAEARARGYRSRAAFKLLELDDMFGLLKKGGRVVDLGAAPGGWTQVVVERNGPAEGDGKVVAIDIQEMESIAGAETLVLDICASDAPGWLRAALDGPADVVLSDMAAAVTGHFVDVRELMQA